MPRGRHLASLDQVSEFDTGRRVAYTDCGLSFREINQRVGRNQATVIMPSMDSDGNDGPTKQITCTSFHHCM
ncbi:hypothetical protein TNCV_4484391 [Trichonephila clavipes]|nr:hypothetical protein TNCV_4484391 [Trichonephila clavipes]